MKKFNIIFMDGYDEVRDSETHEVIFSTKLDEKLSKYINRTTMSEKVVDNVVNIWNKGGNVDGYLLHEGECTQEEREIIVESIFNYANS